MKLFRGKRTDNGEWVYSWAYKYRALSVGSEEIMNKD